MELQQFVTESLCQIINGVQEAQQRTSETKALINPIPRYLGNCSSSPDTLGDYSGRPIMKFDFDVAVTVSESDGAKAGGGIRVAGLGIGASVQNSGAVEHQSRIKFMVPVVFSPYKSEGE